MVFIFLPLHLILQLTREFFIQFMCLAFTLMLVMTKIFPWEDMPESLQLIQFPWRLETLLTLIRGC